MAIDSQRPGLPISLQIVALLFILNGLESLASMANAFFQGDVELNTGVLNVFAGFGLLRLSKGWRLYCLIMSGLSILLSALAIGTVVLTGQAVEAKLLGVMIGRAPLSLILLVLLSIAGIDAWQIRVLNHDVVVALFEGRKTKPIQTGHLRD